MREEEKNTISRDSVCLHISSTGPHFEHMKEFDKSLFKTIYKRAFLQVDDIISKFKKNNTNGILRIKKGYYEHDAVDAESGYENFSNIITFVGKRGAGKSSAMLSFMEALKHYYSYEKMTNHNLPFKFQYANTPLFTCLDCIDGSLLEHGEDIFKIVLAQMYQKFVYLDNDNRIYKEDDFVHRKRELFLQLEGIYRTVCDIERMDNKETQTYESYMSSLRSLSSSQKVKKDFEDLITKFTSLMKYKRLGSYEESSDHYLVITIDDLDLNINNGFSMIEKIHRYCMVQNVIVLLSVDIEQMLSIASKSFYKVLPEVDKLLCNGEDRVYKLSTDYLNKVMPVNYRLYIPELSNYYSSNTLSVDDENSNIKKTILVNLYKITGVCFDSQGTKQHFYEPKSMRQLSCFYLMLKSMKKDDSKEDDLRVMFYKQDIIDEEKKKFVADWDENYILLTEDLYYRIVMEKLYIHKDAYSLCEIIKKEDMRRARDEVVNFYNARVNESNTSKCKFCSLASYQTKNRNVEDCSYGQLIEAIYNMGRIKEGRYKFLVHYLLGYFSYSFTRIYIYEKLSIKDKENILIEKGTFKSLIGKNIIDSWSELIMPNAVKENNKDVEEIGVNIDDRSNYSIEHYSNFKGVTLAPILSFHIQLDEAEKNKYKYISELIQGMELILLFFSNIRENDQNGIISLNSIIWDFEMEINVEGTRIIKFKPQIESVPRISLVGDFSILNFISNSLDAVEILKAVEDNLISYLAERFGLYLTKDRDKKPKLRESFNKVLNNSSLKKKYQNWEKEFGEYSLPLPLYWFDFTYNILKRTKQNMEKEVFMSKEPNDIFFRIQKIFISIQGQLKKQQEFYSFDSYNLVECFSKCPVVEYFLNVKKGSLEETYRKNFWGNVMENLRPYSEDKIL